jgi:15-cis-phytoene synthase
MLSLYQEVSQDCSKITTKKYSTSFASAIRLLHRDLRSPIYNIYGLVRFADEIVDTFHDYPKPELLREFRKETFLAMERGISLNPILNSFQATAKQYRIDPVLIDDFFDSMEMDLGNHVYDEAGYRKYIYGSAEVVGLMCLQVFCEGCREEYEKLKPYAQALGAAFQKVNFLRDIKSDFQELERVYFPGVDFLHFQQPAKELIEKDIERDFSVALQGIIRLPVKARFGVYVAYRYYHSLFTKIRSVQPEQILHVRVRLPNYQKLAIVFRAWMKNHCPFVPFRLKEFPQGI